ncbi:response regulator [Pelosinus fermentans]|uniref:Response regulator receiver protein n=1 Tax=Pelosinus fermentans JBW45 TaxID=1192197 RepID=I8U059_9FIRM|nr:response regulator [Pelosinus fermentans]AJQ25391.1 response regulator receiver protein [Pelosinus fermentans JBW45]
MIKIRVLIVDDSPFSQRLIKDALKESKYEVCGCAGTGSDGIRQYRELQPDLVTMDLTLPDMDGLECCRELLTIDPAGKIVVVSAMKDEAIINRGTAIGVKAFFQKPVKSEALLLGFEQIISQQGNEAGQQHFLEYFIAAFTKNIKDMTGMDVLSVDHSKIQTVVSHGLGVIIGITGSQQGRIMLDVSMDVAQEFTKKLLGTDVVADEDIFNSISEFTNIIAGHSISEINNVLKAKEFEIRLTPPSIIIGESIAIINPKMTSNTVTAKTAIGPLHMNVGFVGGK